MGRNLGKKNGQARKPKGSLRPAQTTSGSTCPSSQEGLRKAR